jgi:hypothetical protein
MKTIDGFPNYTIDYYGTVKSKVSGVEKAQRSAGKGYMVVDVYHKGNCKTSYIHRLVASHFIDNPSNLHEVNHIDGDKTNNHVSNLEWCTHKQNCVHRNITGLGDRGMKKRNNTSGYVGVSWNGNSWQAYIVVNKKQIGLGRFTEKEEAALAYNKASIKYHGDSGRLNEIS